MWIFVHVNTVVAVGAALMIKHCVQKLKPVWLFRRGQGLYRLWETWYPLYSIDEVTSHTFSITIFLVFILTLWKIQTTKITTLTDRPYILIIQIESVEVMYYTSDIYLVDESVW